MKYIRKKVIKGSPYYYFQYGLKKFKGEVTYSKYLGRSLPEDLKSSVANSFSEIAKISYDNLNSEIKEYFPPGGAKKIESHRYKYAYLNHELFEGDLTLFRNLFNILFMLNSNRAEGSRVTRPDIEKVLKRRVKPRTLIDREVVNSVDALNFAFSREFKWNRKSIRTVHRKLFHDIRPDIAGSWKKEDNVAGGGFKGVLTTTTSWREVSKSMGKLLDWFKVEKKKKVYPPILALRFHFKFEAIHPFLDGNGRVGRILLNAFLIEKGFMPVIFFSQNHRAYCNAISRAREGQELSLAKHFVNHLGKTWHSIEDYKKEGVIKGGSAQIGEWEIHRGNIRIY
jgi:Fic family protein